MVWAVPRSLATTDGIDSLYFPADTEMFHFSAFRAAGPMYSDRRAIRSPLQRCGTGRRMVGPDGLEPSTPRLSSACSNQLSYEPKIGN